MLLAQVHVIYVCHKMRHLVEAQSLLGNEDG